jgi:hypothetical protein
MMNIDYPESSAADAGTAARQVPASRGPDQEALIKRPWALPAVAMER